MAQLISLSDRFTRLFNSGIKIEEYQNTLKRGKQRLKQSQERVEELYLPSDYFSWIHKTIKIMVIGATWCSDSIVTIPVIADLAERVQNSKYKIVDKDKHLVDFRKSYTTGGKERVPVVIFANEKGEEITRWVEKSLTNARIRWQLKQRRLSKSAYEKELQRNKELSPSESAQQIFFELVSIIIRIGYDL